METQDRLWLVLGEPGSGKSTLLEAWFRRWAAALGEPGPGTTVPVLIPLRHLATADGEKSAEALAERLWALGARSRALLAGEGDRIYREERAKDFRPAWLLDGLDELPRPLLDESFLQSLVNLPGRKVVSCRTAVYEALRRAASRYREPGREYEVLGLRQGEQARFLRAALPGDRARADRLHAAVRRSPAIRLLAPNPLMLTLIAEVTDPEALPATRAGFYQEAVREMWQRKMGTHPDLLHLARLRDPLLSALAARMGMGSIEGPADWLLEEATARAGSRDTALVEALRRTGLLRLGSRETFSFAHRTFQEFFLARALAAGGLRDELTRHWDDPQYEETLSLLVSLLVQEGRADEAAREVRSLVAWGRQVHRGPPRILWKKRRSPLRVALHLVARSGSPLDAFPADFRQWLWEEAASSQLRREALAADPLSPPAFLARLASEGDAEVRSLAALNPGTPPDVLARLAEDPRMRVWTAANPALPAASLARLAADPKEVVRGNVAMNPGTPPRLLVRLARDPEQGVSAAAIRNPGMPVRVLRVLAGMGDFRTFAMGSPNMPPEILVRMVATEDAGLEMERHLAGRNPNLPVSALRALSAAGRLPRAIAENPNTPPDVLRELAGIMHEEIVSRVLGNANTPQDVLVTLAGMRSADVEYDVDMQSAALGNPSMPPEVLLEIIRNDLYSGLERDATRNPSLPPEGLVLLAERGWEGERAAARSRHAPPELLARLLSTDDGEVRESVARNPNTLLEDLPGE